MHRLQNRNEEGELDKYIIVKYMYGDPLAIQVKVDSKIVKSFVFPPDLNKYS